MLRATDIIPGGPAEKAGIQAGDVIATIDGKSTKGLTSDEDAKMLRGKEGTSCRLGIERTARRYPIRSP